MIKSPPASAVKLARLRELLGGLSEAEQKKVMRSVGKHSIADMEGLSLRDAAFACQAAAKMGNGCKGGAYGG